VSPRIAFTAVVVLSFLLAARAGGQNAADPPDLRRWEFALDGVRYRMLLPQRATRMIQSDGFSVSLSQRLAHQLHLRPAPAGSNGSYAHAEKLSGGAVLRYNIDRDVGSGSGGTEGRLEGVLRIGTRTLAVTCSDQDELFAPRPEWCLQFLRELRIEDGS
jgi:hypothetical protein